MEDTWPEFLFGGLSIDEYVALVREEEREIKDEIVALLCHLRDVAKYPFDSQEETSRRTMVVLEAVFHLFEYV